MNYYKLIILTFTVTALYDVCLRFMALNHEKLPKIVNKMMPFIKDLKPYFKKHTLLAAALIAGFVGATTQPIILKIISFPKNIIVKLMLQKLFSTSLLAVALIVLKA